MLINSPEIGKATTAKILIIQITLDTSEIKDWPPPFTQEVCPHISYLNSGMSLIFVNTNCPLWYAHNFWQSYTSVYIESYKH